MTRSEGNLSRYEGPDRLFHISHQPSFLEGRGDLACCPYCPSGETELRGGLALPPPPSSSPQPPPHPRSSVSTSVLSFSPESFLTRSAPQSSRGPAPDYANDSRRGPAPRGYANKAPGGPAPRAAAESARRGRTGPRRLRVRVRPLGRLSVRPSRRAGAVQAESGLRGGSLDPVRGRGLGRHPHPLWRASDSGLSVCLSARVWVPAGRSPEGPARGGGGEAAS